MNHKPHHNQPQQSKQPDNQQSSLPQQPATRDFQVTSAKFHQGPLPSPEVLAGYEQIHPGAANRIIRMAEQQVKHRQSLEQKIVSSDHKIQSRAMNYSFFLTVLLFVFGVYLVIQDRSLGYLAVFGPAVFHVSAFAYDRYQRQVEAKKPQE